MAQELVEYLRGGEPFEFKTDGDAGVLLLHGFTGSPFEVRALGQALHGQGYGVLAPALPGHATTHTALRDVTPEKYLQSAEDAFEEIRARYARVYVIGLSLGGTLALHIAANKPVAGIIAISAPVMLSSVVMNTVPLLIRLVPHVLAPIVVGSNHREVVGYRKAAVADVGAMCDVLDWVKWNI